MKRLFLLTAAVLCLSACSSLKTQTNKKTIQWHTFNNQQYAFLTHVKPAIAQAREICESHGAMLVRVDSSAENEFIRSQAFASALPDTDDGDQFWLGGNDQQQEGHFIWDNGHSSFWPKSHNAYTNWGSTSKGSQPNNFFKNYEDEDCIVIRKDGFWYDIGCVTRLAFPICEKE